MVTSMAFNGGAVLTLMCFMKLHDDKKARAGVETEKKKK